MPEEILEPVSESSASSRSETPATSSPESVPTPETESVPESALDRAGEQYQKILTQASSAKSTTTDDEVNQDVEVVGALEEAEKQVHTLVELAQVKGVAHAVRVARRMNDLYVLDTMHDELADKLYEGLLAKGLITKE